MQTSPRVLKNIPTPSLNKPIVYDDGMTEDLIDEIREDNNFKIEKRLKMERASARLVALKRARLNKKRNSREFANIYNSRLANNSILVRFHEG